MEICTLCTKSKYPIIFTNNNFRIVLINDQNYPGYCRIETIKHIKEMTDLDETLQQECISLVFAIEKGLRNILNPEKINIASLGNKTPHLHWHIIPRFKNDNHFPESIWAKPIKNNKFDFDKDNEKKFIKKIIKFLN